MSPSSIDIVIIHRNTFGVTSACIDSLLVCSLADNINIIVIDNGSEDDSIDRLSECYPEVKIVKAGSNLGYSKACNLGAAHSASEFIVFSNSDVRYLPDTIEHLVSVMQGDADVSMCGPQQFYPDGSWQQSYDYFPGKRLAFRNILGVTALWRLWKAKTIFMDTRILHSNPVVVEFLDGAVLAVRRTCLQAVGGFDERFFFFCEDVQLSYALRGIGKKVVMVPSARVFHERGFTRRRNLADDIRYLGANERARAMFLRQHFHPFTTRFTLIANTLYYGLIVVLITPRLLFSRDSTRSALQHRISVLQHLIAVCADELEYNYETKHDTNT